MTICVTNRLLCQEDFLLRLSLILQNHPQAVLLREKDLTASEYEALAAVCQKICLRHKVPLIIHGHPSIARKLRIKMLHLPLSQFLEQHVQLTDFPQIGVSVHSVEEAVQAEKLGAGYLIAGHIFPTACKALLPARGLSFLQNVCQAVHIPVYAIGGILPEHFDLLQATGAAGCCLMSSLMICPPDKIPSLCQNTNSQES